MDFYEDSYQGSEQPNGRALEQTIAQWCGPDSILGALNIPVWIDADVAPGEACEYCPDGVADATYEDCGSHRLSVGVMLPRHGDTSIWFTDSWTWDDVMDIRSLMLRIWALRADTGFARHTVRLAAVN